MGEETQRPAKRVQKGVARHVCARRWRGNPCVCARVLVSGILCNWAERWVRSRSLRCGAGLALLGDSSLGVAIAKVL